MNCINFKSPFFIYLNKQAGRILEGLAKIKSICDFRKCSFFSKNTNIFLLRLQGIVLNLLQATFDSDAILPGSPYDVLINRTCTEGSATSKTRVQTGWCKAGIPNLFTISYHLGTPYCQRVPLLPEQLIGSNLCLFRRIIYIKITIKTTIKFNEIIVFVHLPPTGRSVA